MCTVTTKPTMKTMSGVCTLKIGEISLTDWNICRRCVVLYIYTSLFVTDVRRAQRRRRRRRLLTTRSRKQSNDPFLTLYLFDYAKVEFNCEKCKIRRQHRANEFRDSQTMWPRLFARYFHHWDADNRWYLWRCVCIWSQLLSGHFHGVRR